MNRLIRGIGIAAVTFVATAPAAQATVIDATAATNPLNFSWSFDTDGAGPGTTILDGTGSIAVSGFNSNLLTLTITLTNDATLTSERLTAFGFGITPDATGIGFSDPQGNDGGIVDAVLGGNFPAFQSVEVCAYGGQNCAGGGNGGILGAGGTDTFIITLTGTWGDSVDIAPLAFKYQTGAGSFEFESGTGSGSGSGSGSGVPEPTVLSLLGAAFVGAAYRLRRRRA